MRKLIIGLILVNSVLFAYQTGDSIIVYFGSEGQYKCEAVIITAGSSKSKVEYTEYCSLRFIDKRDAGQQEWVPNSAISRN